MLLKGFLIVAASALLAAQPGARPESSSLPIEWRIAPRQNSADEVQLGLRYRSNNGNSNGNSEGPIRRAQLQGLDEAVLASANGGPLRFRIAREAGTVECSGTGAQGRGTGTCSFSANPAFAAELERRGLGRPSQVQQFHLALHPVTSADLAELDRLGYARPDMDGLVAMGIHGATGDYLRELDRAGYRVGTVEQLVGMRIHGVTGDYIGRLAAIGPQFRSPRLQQRRGESREHADGEACGSKPSESHATLP